MFAPLNNYSCYSFLEGLSRPGDLAARAADLGYSAVGLTDRGMLAGSIEFYEACQSIGIQALIGASYPIQYAGRQHSLTGNLVLLATNLEGWRNLCRLSSLLQTDSKIIPHGALPFTAFADSSDGLICLTGGVNSLVFSPEIFTGVHKAGVVSSPRRQQLPPASQQLLGRLSEIFTDRIYIQLTQNETAGSPAARIRIDAAQHFGLPVVFAPECFYLDEADAEVQRVLTAMRTNSPLAALRVSQCAPPGSHLHTPQDLAAFYQAFPDQLAAQLRQTTLEIAAQCTLELPLGQLRFPTWDSPAQGTPDEQLRRRAYSGARQLYPNMTQAVTQRLEHELEVIRQSGFASLFLIMADVMAFARQADIPTASRGSASSSLVSHCLGITTPDPLGLDLYFERFLNPARSSPPDIDTDICSKHRDQLIQYVYDTFGHERVAMVATINRFRPRSALRETAKAYGLTSRQITKLVNDLPRRGWSPSRSHELPEESPYARLAAEHRQAPYTSIFSTAARLLDLPHHLSIHPGGIVIAPERLTDLLPTQLASKGVVITQFDLDGVEKLGLVKIDLLGIRGLTVLGDVADYIRQVEPGRAARRLEILDAIPVVDSNTAETVRQGKTIGCFQIESPGMQATLREIQASSIADIMVALALYRPGPLTGGLKDAFVRRHLGQETVVYLHPALAPLLSDTYGVILYQEQVLRIAHELAGLSLADADLLRRAMSHFDPGQQMITLKQKFIHGAELHSQMPPEVSTRIWDLMAAFAGYGFPKAHAASYAEIGWRSAWLKSYFPAQFMAAVLANWGGYYSQRIYLMEARHLGLEVRPPDVRYAKNEFSTMQLDGQSVLFMGLNQVRDLTRRTQQRIQQTRPFASLADFLQRVDPRPKEAENLVKAGALAGFGLEHELISRIQNGGRDLTSQQLPLFELPAQTAPSEPWTAVERAAAQEEVLGLSVDHHPLELVQHYLETAGVISTLEAGDYLGRTVRFAGVPQTWRRAQTFTGDEGYLLILEDLVGSVFILIERSLFRRSRRVLQMRKPIVISGEMRP
ncbi:MAG: DNA polymerase III subunit alpha, partial [Anaerolineales bacterium]